MIKRIDHLPDGYVKWHSDVLGVTYAVPDRCCLLCSKCTDIFLDYTNGPYFVVCGDHQDIPDGMNGGCKYFEEEKQ